MKMTLKKINGILGVVQLFINAVVIIPEILHILATGKGGFGYGILLLSVTLPLSYMSVFAILGFLDYRRGFSRIKKWLIAAYITAVAVCALSFLWVPMVPFSLAGIPLFIALSLKITHENIGKRIALTNAIALLCQGILLFMAFR
ncbi:MAG: hypothetical protein KDD04_02285 [Sinomicrobium sp.]|nr:hypothetical protein [Sinomicrobium sp.]